jgi:hypothetical protein
MASKMPDFGKASNERSPNLKLDKLRRQPTQLSLANLH